MSWRVCRLKPEDRNAEDHEFKQDSDSGQHTTAWRRPTGRNQNGDEAKFETGCFLIEYPLEWDRSRSDVAWVTIVGAGKQNETEIYCNEKGAPQS